MNQMRLLRPRAPELPDTIDLRCGDIGATLDDIEPGSVDLVIADPPWGHYSLGFGNVLPHDVYVCLSEAQIGEHLARAAALLKPGGRLALWTCWPLLVEALSGSQRPPWLSIPGIEWKTGGAWNKDGRPSNGYHWRGHSEPVLVGVRSGGAAGRCASMLRSGFTSEPEQHSRKPAPWMADWLRAWVPPGGLVLDLYAGLGSVPEAVVMAGEGRRYIGAEIDEDRHAAALAIVRRASL
jgi:DNA modification methylase